MKPIVIPCPWCDFPLDLYFALKEFSKVEPIETLPSQATIPFYCPRCDETVMQMTISPILKIYELKN